jgi:GTP pyrophosphokinase
MDRSATELVPATLAALDAAGLDAVVRAQCAEVGAILDAIPMGRALPLAGRLAPALEAGFEPDATLTAALGPEVLGLARAAARLPRPAAAARRLPTEGLRKMLLATARDVRVVVVRLADQLARLRHLRRTPALARPDAELTLELYAPLANRLGIWQMKWELEDLAFRVLEPVAYRQLALELAETRTARERFIRSTTRELERLLAAAGIPARVDGRPKHLRSIWRKMQRKGVGFEGVHDVRALRVLVGTVADCYAALGVVHGQWTPVPGEFDDYIARPKRNGYASLHTAVQAADGRAFEVQIRSEDMHAHAELGVAAHWRYKEGGRGDESLEARIAWLRQLLDGDTGGDGEDFVDRFRAELFEDRVYALTPTGDVVDLPAGSTPLDFAYHLHTDLGHRCRGARVDGRLVPLTQRLVSGQQVEVITIRDGEPSRDWLNPGLGYIASNRARDKLRAFFRAKHHEDNARAGREIVEREQRRLHASLPLEAFVTAFGAGTVDGFLAKVGAGDVSAAQLAGVMQRALSLERPPLQPPLRPGPTRGPRSRTAITLRGVGDLLYQMARCCSPVPPDALGGYLTRGRGLTVHRSDCPHLLRLRGLTPERVVDVEWGDTGTQAFRVEVVLRAEDRTGLLRDVSAVLAEEGVDVAALHSDAAAGAALVRLSVQVADLAQLQRALQRLGRVSGVVEARRAGRA